MQGNGSVRNVACKVEELRIDMHHALLPSVIITSVTAIDNVPEAVCKQCDTWYILEVTSVIK